MFRLKRKRETPQILTQDKCLPNIVLIGDVIDFSFYFFFTVLVILFNSLVS